MVSLRSASTAKRQNGKSLQDGDRRRSRLARELEIDGTAALRCGKIAHKAAKTGSFRGARYEIAEDGISWKTTGKRPASDNAVATPPPPAKRLRGESAAPTACQLADPEKVTSRKRKLESNAAAADANYLAETVQRLKKARYPSRSSRQAELRMMLPYLNILEPARSHRIARQAPLRRQRPGDAPDAYELTGGEAKAFLRSDEHIDAPIFLAGQEIPIIESGSDNSVRPIEQIFEWLDMDEPHNVADLEKNVEGDGTLFPEKSVTTAEIRERFLTGDHEQAYPWNFPELPLPTVCESMPDFLRHPSCNMLRDIVRRIQDVDIADICPETCPRHGRTAEKCPKHFLTAEELLTTNQVFRQWLGTIMIAEAGALSAPHFDTFGFGTCIVCGEGEIGFAWTSNTTARTEGVSTKDRWLYRVLRPGDAVYMPPGTYHLVFRLPGGKQTMGWAPRVLRYCDVNKWLEIMSIELQEAIEQGAPNDEHIILWRCLSLGAREVITQARKRKTFEKFGGEKTVRAAEKLLDKIEKQVQQLV